MEAILSSKTFIHVGLQGAMAKKMGTFRKGICTRKLALFESNI
jgi:hypothetical protein